MAIEMDTEFGDKSMDTITEEILVGMGVPCTDANFQYLFTKLCDIVEYVTELSAEIAVKTTLGEKMGSIDADRDTIEL